MPKKAKDAPTIALAEAMLRGLASLRQQGGEAYPPRLRQLAALTGESPTDDLIEKAAGKKAFTERAVVTEKNGRKPSLDAPVYFKEDAPAKKPAARRAAAKKPKDDGGELAERMVLVLQAQRRLGADAYPPTLRRLAELCDLNASDTRVANAASHKAMTDATVVAAKARGKPVLDAPVVLREDLDGGLRNILPALLRFGLSAVPGGGKKPEVTAFTASEVGKRFIPELQKPVQAAVEHAMERQEMPEGVAWVVAKMNTYLFLGENMRPGAMRPAAGIAAVQAPVADGAPSRPAGDFAGAFRAAFEHLDHRNGATNFVKLADLRRALAGFGRDEFDAGLRSLRLGGEFALDSHEGLHGSLSPEEREAGVREAGSLLIYVSRR